MIFTERGSSGPSHLLLVHEAHGGWRHQATWLHHRCVRTSEEGFAFHRKSDGDMGRPGRWWVRLRVLTLNLFKKSLWQELLRKSITTWLFGGTESYKTLRHLFYLGMPGRWWVRGVVLNIRKVASHFQGKNKIWRHKILEDP